MKAAPPETANQLAWLGAIREPHQAFAWSLADWEHVVRVARRLRLLARLAESLESEGLLTDVPVEPRRHMIAEQRLSRFRIAAMTWALERIRAVIDDPSMTLVLLKGAAYLGQELPIAAGRMPSDVDILVPLDRLADVRARLLAAHWAHAELDEYDQRYYELWSHEVPPLLHPVHPIELDLHHNILPPTARTKVDAALLLARLQPTRWQGWQVFDPADQVLHSAAHLFFDSEIRDRVRDLVDLDGLFRHFGARPAFWQELPARAHELGLVEPLALAVHFCVEWLGTPVPESVRGDLIEGGLSRSRRRWLVPLLGTILMPQAPDARGSWRQDAASWLFLARYHRWRMPLHILLPHLARKARLRAGLSPER